jgi:4-diphosphocytidyl-2-C-methyl-D-erythritol kinase
LTLSLRIIGVRDDGYHLLDAEMVSLDLADTLVFGPAGGSGDGDQSDVEVIPLVETLRFTPSLVTDALAAVGRKAFVRLEKRIPVGGGLGGGSADAAAVLRWAGRGDDVELAASLGADVPFCLRGGRARVTGIGDVLEPLPHEPRTFTLFTPPLAVSTPAVYAQWDAMGGPTGGGPNDLEAAALAVEPRLAAWRDRFADVTSKTPVLAGSGSTWFVEGAYPGEGRVVARTEPPEG